MKFAMVFVLFAMVKAEEIVEADDSMMLQASKVSLAERSSTSCSIVSGGQCGDARPTCSAGCTASRSGSACPSGNGFWQCKPSCTDKQACFASCTSQDGGFQCYQECETNCVETTT